jgi:uncharacterized protein YdeI (YjbR/CyaY-like superfamily)
MAARDPRIDAYIEKSAPFARPILRHLREVVHAGCPEVAETMKWSFPHFDYKGILCSMAAFKAHCAFNFWTGAEVLEGAAREGAMGQFGRITSVRELPSKKVLVAYVKKAVALKDAGVKPAWVMARADRAKARAKRPELPVPEELAAALALKKNKKAKEAFEALPPGHRRSHIEYIVEAKRPETRARRAAQTVERLKSGTARAGGS